MAFIMASSREELLSILQTRLLKLVQPGEKDAITWFNELFFGIVPLEELLARHDTDLLGCTLSFWRFFQNYAGQGEKLRVFNPDTQQHGWQSTHSVVEILHRDSPFLVDSVRMVLNRQGYAIHTLQNSVMAVKRNNEGVLETVLDPHSKSAQAQFESVMYIEIDRCASATELKRVATSLEEVLSHVRAAVADFAAMEEQARALMKSLKSKQFGFFPAAERKECEAFIAWLLEDHFTFLGYERFSINEGLQNQQLGILQEHCLGVLALNPRDESLTGLPDKVVDYLRAPVLLSFAKASQSSKVHRPAYPDYVSIREVDDKGKVLVEHRFMGLYTSRVYADTVELIPHLRQKVAAVRTASGFTSHSHLGKELDQVLQVLPRDDLFQMSEGDLRDTALSIVQIQERNQIRVFLRSGNYGRFYYCLVYVPREI
jgi:glutamate dehydrogenase